MTAAAQLDRVHADELHARLGLATPLVMPTASRGKPLTRWDMLEDDGPILRYLFSQLRPRRHLEFGTWQGAGALLCLQSCDATVWSINLLEGETKPDGSWGYGTSYQPGESPPVAWTSGKTTRSGVTWCRTDAAGFVGRLVHDAGLGHRFCQVYCDSTRWDASNYPANFFDTAFVDGGHAEDVVRSDTRKALSVVRPGGVVLWHDFCLDEAVRQPGGSVAGVVAAIEADHALLCEQCSDLFWIEPSWILLGIKR